PWAASSKPSPHESLETIFGNPQNNAKLRIIERCSAFDSVPFPGELRLTEYRPLSDSHYDGHGTCARGRWRRRSERLRRRARRSASRPRTVAIPGERHRQEPAFGTQAAQVWA